MKKTIVFVALLFSAITASAQFYVSLSGGATLPAHKDVIGSKSYFGEDFSTDIMGSYGEGIVGQFRLGYFFNEVIGLELAGSYLHGVDHSNNQILMSNFNADTGEFESTSELVDMYARVRAFGASLSIVANVTKNVYVRVGALTKVGGKTETFTSITDLTVPTYDVSTGVPVLSGYIGYDAEMQTDFKGKMPFGFVGAAGYRFHLSDNISIFAEIEYMNIQVQRDSSSLSSFSDGTITVYDLLGNVVETSVDSEAFATALGAHGAALGSESLVGLSTLAQEDFDWSSQNIFSPYSSLGANIGVTYKF